MLNQPITRLQIRNSMHVLLIYALIPLSIFPAFVATFNPSALFTSEVMSRMILPIKFDGLFVNLCLLVIQLTKGWILADQGFDGIELVIAAIK